MEILGLIVGIYLLSFWPIWLTWLAVKTITRSNHVHRS